MPAQQQNYKLEGRAEKVQILPIVKTECTDQKLLGVIEHKQHLRDEVDAEGPDSDDEEGDDDVSNESVAEKKILKIDLRLNKNKMHIDKT